MQCIDFSLILPDMLPRLWSFALRLTENEYEAEELVHQACARGLEDSHKLPRDISPPDWMFSIVYSIWRADPMGHARRHCTAKKSSLCSQHLFQKNVCGIDPPR
jgi:DNA-directed RNA polymerase specialized sigma24 family protein